MKNAKKIMKEGLIKTEFNIPSFTLSKSVALTYSGGENDAPAIISYNFIPGYDEYVEPVIGDGNASPKNANIRDDYSDISFYSKYEVEQENYNNDYSVKKTIPPHLLKIEPYKKILQKGGYYLDKNQSNYDDESMFERNFDEELKNIKLKEQKNVGVNMKRLYKD